MKRKIIPALLITAVIAMSISGCSKKEAVIEEAAPDVTYVEVMNTSAASIENKQLYNGTVEASNEINVIGLVAGKVVEVNYAVGDYVNEGDVLYKVDTTDLLNSRATAEASLASVNANINNAQVSLDLVNGAQMQTAITGAKTQLDNAQITFDQISTTYENNKVLYENGIISKVDMDKTTDGYNQAKLALEQAKASYEETLKMPEENLRKAQAGLEVAEASKASVLAQLNTIDKSISDCTVTSPISGYVTECNVKVGGMASSASVPFKVSDTSRVAIRFSVSEDIINSIVSGDIVEVSIPAVSAEPVKGEITEVNPAANDGGTYDVKVELNNPDNLIKSGMFGETTFIKAKSDKAISVPVNAVITKDGETYVYVNENNTAVKKLVETGLNDGTNVEITKGLKENENVVVKGQTYLDEGDSIAVASEE